MLYLKVLGQQCVHVVRSLVKLYSWYSWQSMPNLVGTYSFMPNTKNHLHGIIRLGKQEQIVMARAGVFDAVPQKCEIPGSAQWQEPP